MRTPLVYDGRNIYSIADMSGAGIESYSIGRPEVSKRNGAMKALEKAAVTE